MKNFGDQNEDEDLDKINRDLTVLQFKTKLHAMATHCIKQIHQKKNPVKKIMLSLYAQNIGEDWHTKTPYTCAKISVFIW